MKKVAVGFGLWAILLAVCVRQNSGGIVGRFNSIATIGATSWLHVRCEEINKENGFADAEGEEVGYRDWAGWIASRCP